MHEDLSLRPYLRPNTLENLVNFMLCNNFGPWGPKIGYIAKSPIYQIAKSKKATYLVDKEKAKKRAVKDKNQILHT